jgi:uncharacterized damage-inducible protein DinB
MNMSANQSLRDHVLYLLKGEGAHAKLEDVISGFPIKLRGKKVSGFPHSAWMLLEHLRIAQWDILEFSRNPKHVSPEWPDGYWPKQEAPPSAAAWTASIRSFEKDMRVMQALVRNPKTDLYAPFPWGSGQTVLREALLVADHNAYHGGQLLMLRRQLGAWRA